MNRSGIVPLEAGTSGYPPGLLSLEDPPPVLFTLGRVDLLVRPSVAIVGTRQATAYGLRVTARLAAGVSAAGVTVVSGLARGVDAHAHRAALSGPGRTIAVLGTGADVAYPKENEALYDMVRDEGLIVSESLPGVRAHPGSFPRRNRIIAALADVVVVTEAGIKSGALITAGVAVALGRMHGAVPGPVDVPTSLGSNQLLRDGAQVVTTVDDLLGLVRLTTRGRTWPMARSGMTERAPAADLSADEARLVDVLRAGPRLPDELLAATGMAPAILAATLAILTVMGHATVEAGGEVRLTDASDS